MSHVGLAKGYSQLSVHMRGMPEIVALSPTGNQLAVAYGSDTGERTGGLAVLDVTTGATIPIMGNGRAQIRVLFSAVNLLFAIQKEDNSAVVTTISYSVTTKRFEATERAWIPKAFEEEHFIEPVLGSQGLFVLESSSLLPNAKTTLFDRKGSALLTMQGRDRTVFFDDIFYDACQVGRRIYVSGYVVDLDRMRYSVQSRGPYVESTDGSIGIFNRYREKSKGFNQMQVDSCEWHPLGKDRLCKWTIKGREVLSAANKKFVIDLQPEFRLRGFLASIRPVVTSWNPQCCAYGLGNEVIVVKAVR